MMLRLPGEARNKQTLGFGLETSLREPNPTRLSPHDKEGRIVVVSAVVRMNLQFKTVSKAFHDNHKYYNNKLALKEL